MFTRKLLLRRRRRLMVLLRVRRGCELVENKENIWIKFIKGFTGPMPVMIWISIILEMIMKDWTDFWVLMTLQILNGTVGFYEDYKAGNAVEALEASLKPIAVAKRDGVFNNINAAELVPGDRIALNAGANVPADCTLCAGDQIQVDQAQLTGESLPVTMRVLLTLSRPSLLQTGTFTVWPVTSATRTPWTSSGSSRRRSSAPFITGSTTQESTEEGDRSTASVTRPSKLW